MKEMRVKETEGKSHIHTSRQIERHKYRHTDRQTDRQTY
jgi:hypothetical protein